LHCHGVNGTVTVNDIMLHLVSRDNRIQHRLNDALVAMFEHHSENGSAARVLDFDTTFNDPCRPHAVTADTHPVHDFWAKERCSILGNIQTFDHFDLGAHDVLATFC